MSLSSLKCQTIRDTTNADERLFKVCNLEIKKSTDNLECVRNIIDHRLEALGVQQIKIPLRIADEQPHIPIWVTPDYETNPNLLLLINDRTSDGGMWSMRVIQSEDLNVYCF